MARASTLPFRNFVENLRRARALARLDGYLEDVVLYGGRGPIGAFTSFPVQFARPLGIDEEIRGIERKLQRQLRTKLGDRYMTKIQAEIDAVVEPYSSKILTVFRDLGLVMNQTLPEQALVLGVSAFEVYLREMTASVIALNPSVRRRFHKEIERGFSLQKLEEYMEDAKRVQGEIVAESIGLGLDKFKSLLGRIMGPASVFYDSVEERRYVKIIELRNILVHRAGLPDPRFRRITKHRGAKGRPIVVTRRSVLRSLALLMALAYRIETRFHSDAEAPGWIE